MKFSAKGQERVSSLVPSTTTVGRGSGKAWMTVEVSVSNYPLANSTQQGTLAGNKVQKMPYFCYYFHLLSLNIIFCGVHIPKTDEKYACMLPL